MSRYAPTFPLAHPPSPTSLSLLHTNRYILRMHCVIVSYFWGGRYLLHWKEISVGVSCIQHCTHGAAWYNNVKNYFEPCVFNIVNSYSVSKKKHTWRIKIPKEQIIIYSCLDFMTKERDKENHLILKYSSDYCFIALQTIHGAIHFYVSTHFLYFRTTVTRNPF